jgi:acyl dehydratase
MPKPSNYSTATLSEFIGHDFGSSAEVVVDQGKINEFASATGDHQWIHIDAEKCKKHSPFGTTIAHGFLTLSLLAADVGAIGIVPSDAKAVLNYGVDKARFLAPVPSGATVSASYKLAGVEAKGPGNHLIRIEATLNIKGQEKPAVIAELLAMIIA